MIEDGDDDESTMCQQKSVKAFFSLLESILLCVILRGCFNHPYPSMEPVSVGGERKKPYEFFIAVLIKFMNTKSWVI